MVSSPLLNFPPLVYFIRMGRLSCHDQKPIKMSYIPNVFLKIEQMGLLPPSRKVLWALYRSSFNSCGRRFYILCCQ